jgi:uncharacterized protein YkwD
VRRTPALLACVCAGLALLLPTAPAVADAESEAVEALNDMRRASGAPALRVSESLNRSAGAYARRMIELDFFGHGSSIDVAGSFRSAGETLAWHSGLDPEPRRTVARWMDSPGHRAVLMSPGYRWVGVGLARGRLGSRAATTWVAHVGSR